MAAVAVTSAVADFPRYVSPHRSRTRDEWKEKGMGVKEGIGHRDTLMSFSRDVLGAQ